VGEDGNPLDTLDDLAVSAGGAGTEAESVDDRGWRACARARAHARGPWREGEQRGRGGGGRDERARGTGAGGALDLKVSRAAEKLAHLISNGSSFNNIPRRHLPGPPFLRAVPSTRALTCALFPRRVATRASREIKVFRAPFRAGVSRPCSRRLHDSQDASMNHNRDGAC